MDHTTVGLREDGTQPKRAITIWSQVTVLIDGGAVSAPTAASVMEKYVLRLHRNTNSKAAQLSLYRTVVRSALL
jgi:hypothetical protein